MPDDPRSEFERIFGVTQRAGETKSLDDAAVRSATQRLPGDSDVLGIRTDSDRFLVKSVPEHLPIDPKKDAAPPISKLDPSKDMGAEPAKSSPDAMTIALNVNVFANLADAKAGDGKSGSAISADGPTFVIPLPKQSTKPTSTADRSSATAANDEKRPSSAQGETEFTRILHVQDTITIPKPSPQAKPSEATSVSLGAEPKGQQSVPAQPVVSSLSGPSDFTKVVKGSELRAIQERLAASTAQRTGAQQQWQPGSAPPLPQYVPAQDASWPTPPAAPHAHAPAHPQSKMSQYMPLIIALNVLFVLAILLIVFFAVKK